MTFEQLVQEAITKGGTLNLIFEERLFAMIGTLERIAAPLSDARIPFELIGGGAVMVQVRRIEPSAVRNTKVIDLLICRSDVERIKQVAAQHGFVFRHSAGLDMLLPPGEVKAANAVHLVFSGELVRPSQVVPNPPIRPEFMSIHGVPVAVIPVADLLQMKLSSFRDIDRVHVRDMDSVGLITPEIEGRLSTILRQRLLVVRDSE